MIKVLVPTRTRLYSVFYVFKYLTLQILHVSDLEIRETKMMGSSPVIIVMVCKLLVPEVHC